MNSYHIVIDTNVIVAALRSQNGASFRLVQMLYREDIVLHLSTPLLYEYEEQLYSKTSTATHDINTFLSNLYSLAVKHKIYYAVRPITRDVDDDMIADIAFAAQANYVISYNKSDLEPIHNEYGIPIITPKEFLDILGEIL
ncbi:MAG: putative toxin-antitoxin system toxin component, PIN family [Candidatus Kapabacteria bacterium]|jgi:putative PIN family toxin of toxin-antitoxin system|nr:putative toxin-antitoxin system toxin component, PIN family [Candidatus Kapabacteria bacterium]